MPTYEFRCNKCETSFSIREHIADFGRTKVACPKCKSADVERVLSGFYARTPRKS
jgi:putative FmdB family regulatory protein